MEYKNAKRAAEILAELEEMEKHKGIMSKYQTAHFEAVEHYGDNAKRVYFEKRHNEKFVNVVEEIIKELKSELEAL